MGLECSFRVELIGTIGGLDVPEERKGISVA